MIGLILTIILLPPVQNGLHHLDGITLATIQEKMEYYKFKMEQIEDGHVPNNPKYPEIDDLDMLLDRADRPENKWKRIP